MPKIVVLANNIYNEDREKTFRGDCFEASQEFCDMVLTGDAEAEREPRITVIQETKRGRPPKVQNDEDC